MLSFKNKNNLQNIWKENYLRFNIPFLSNNYELNKIQNNNSNNFEENDIRSKFAKPYFQRELIQKKLAKSKQLTKNKLVEINKLLNYVKSLNKQRK